MNKLNELIDMTNVNFKEIAKEERINELIRILSLKLEKLRNFQSKIVSFILKNEWSEIDPEIISFSYLQTILNEIKHKINGSDIFPWNLFNENNLLYWYQKLPMRITVKSGKIVTEIEIPLISTKENNIYKAITAPFVRNGFLYCIIPEAPYFISDEVANEIGFLSEKEFKQCFLNKNNIYTCPRNFLMYVNHDFCEIAILLNDRSKAENCKLQSLPQENLIIKTDEINKYYFALTRTIELILECKSNVTKINLNGTGILSIEQDCLVYNGKIHIIPYWKEENSNHIKYEYIHRNFTINKMYTNETDEHTSIIEQHDIQFWIGKNTKRNELYERISTVSQTHVGQINGIHVILVIIFIITIIAAYLKYKFLKRIITSTEV